MRTRYNGPMSDGQKPCRRLQFSLRQVFKIVTIVAILIGWAVWNWRRARERQEFLGVGGAINGHERIIQAYSCDWDAKSIKWLLFGERRVYFINLYPATYDDAYLVQMRNLFPEAEISSSWDPNADQIYESHRKIRD
jgi:hypothetical protein